MPRIRALTLDTDSLRQLMARQHGVVSRRQVVAHGGDATDIRRLLRRREWSRVHAGVYVDHTGPLTWEQRAWAAVLHHWPAALHRESALRLHGLRRDRRARSVDEPVWLLVDASRTVTTVPGVRVERVRNARAWLSPHLSPPCVRVELAVLKVASGRSLTDAVALISDACQQRRTDPVRLLSALGDLPRLPGSTELATVLQDVASGALSVLEQRYLRDVERAHHLPREQRQARASIDGRVTFRDVQYEHGVLVELDGRFGHTDAADRWADLDRDLAAATRSLVTVRLGWAQVLAPCRVAAAMATILGARGWGGVPRPCRPGCPAGVRVGSGSSIDADPTQTARGA